MQSLVASDAGLSDQVPLIASAISYIAPSVLNTKYPMSYDLLWEATDCTIDGLDIHSCYFEDCKNITYYNVLKTLFDAQLLPDCKL